jgi:hypothetical protein
LPPRLKKKRRAEGKPPAKGKPPAEAAAQEPPAEAAAQEPPAEAAAQAERKQGATALLRRAARAAKAAARTAQPEPWLDAWTNMGVARYGRTEEPPVAGDNKLSEEDPAPVADGAGAKSMPQQTRDTRSSRSAGPPEKQPWTLGGTYWPSRR